MAAVQTDADATTDVAITGDVAMVVATMIADAEILVVIMIVDAEILVATITVVTMDVVIMTAVIMIVAVRQSNLQDRCLRHHHLDHLDHHLKTVAATDK